ncbi:MAG: PAS-domain containing protein, partial [Rhodospirillaceae bacterium]
LDLSRRGIGRRIHARGLRIGGWDGQPLADALWMRDVTEDREALEQLAEEADALTSERDGLRALIDALPVGVWMRDEALALADCNQAHLRALDLPDREAALSQPREIAEGVTGQEMRALAARSRAAGTGSAGRFHVLIGGERRLLEVTETPTAPGGSKPGHTVGLAYDITMIEDLETRLTRDAAAQAEVLERLGTAIAVFGSDTRLSFHNTAFAKLWSLDTDWLAQSPGYGAFLERLREGRRLPEVADFPAFKAGELKQFAKLLQPKEDILHLPDGTTLRRVIAPHPLGGLLTTFEDVTDSLALERSFNQLTAVQRETLDHLKEAVAVFGPDGTLQLCNPPFTALWGLSPDGSTSPTEAGTNADADGGPSTGAGAGAALSATMAQLTELAARVEQSEADAARAGLGGPSGHFRRRLLAPPDSRETRSGRLTRSDGTHLDYTGVPLPDGGLLISFLDVTDRVRVETALRERTDALRAAELLKGEFISHVSFELRTPLTTIAGFAEILAEGYYGALNPRQSDYAKVIAETAEQVTRLLDDI